MTTIFTVNLMEPVPDLYYEFRKELRKIPHNVWCDEAYRVLEIRGNPKDFSKAFRQKYERYLVQSA